MYFAGVDIGSLATKVCIVNENSEIVGFQIDRTGAKVREIGGIVLESCLKNLGIERDEIAYVVATGYGRNLAISGIADEKVTEITCHARGAKKLFENCHTVIDIGGQDSKVMRLDDSGKVVNFTMNDKCAAGTGKFLEVLASTLGIKLDEMGKMALKSETPVEITSVCTVFAESEVISLLAEGKEVRDIVAGLHRAIAKRVSGLVRQIGIAEDVVMTGGVAKNKGVVKSLEDELGVKINVPDEPQIVGAYGAGIIACEKFLRNGK